MSVVKMKKLSLVGLKDDREKLLKDLLWLSQVDVSPLEERAGETEEGITLTADGSPAETDRLRGQLSDLSEAMETLRPYGNKKKKLFTPRQSLTRERSEEILARRAELLEKTERALSLKGDIARKMSEVNRLSVRKQSLEPWLTYPLPLGMTGTEDTVFALGTLPSDADRTPADETFDGGYVEKVGQVGEKDCVLAVCTKTDGDAMASYLASMKFTPAPFQGLTGTPAEESARCDRETEEANAGIETDRSELTQLSDTVEEMELLWDALDNELRIAEVRSHLLSTGSCILLEGYLPEKSLPKLEKVLSGYDCCWSTEDAAVEDDPPVLLQNNRLVTPFESVTAMYALPVYGGFDPNPAMSPFYFLLFGMMLGDAGYGLLISVGCWLGLKFLKPKKGLASILRLFMFCGVSAIFWGLMFGTVFGNAITVIAQTYLGLTDFTFKPLWFDPINDPMTMLILSIVVGYIQILTSLVLKGVVAMRNGDWKGCFFDAGFWLLALLGVGLIALGIVFPGILSKVGMYVALAGALGLVCTQGRDKKGFIGKLGGGLLSLYDSTGYLSDLMSYSRVLALGLSSGVISMVFNTMGSLLGGGFFSFLFFLVIFAIGHALNIALSILSAYVHASRLQYIEFFGRFYESGGRPYQPFAADGKYTDPVLDENKQ